MTAHNKNIPALRFKEFDSEWEKRKLEDVAKIGRGKSKHRPRNASFLYGGKYPFVQTGDIKEADLFLTKYSQTYSEEGLKQSKLWDENTLCITIAANIAETAILKIKACFPDSIIGLAPKENQTTVLFVKYQFDKFKIEIQNLSQGVAQDNLNQEKLSNIEFQFPTLPEQQKIASFLSAIDEKIQQLTRKKELLEQYKKGMMQRLFCLNYDSYDSDDNQDDQCNHGNQKNHSKSQFRPLRFKDENGKDYPKWEEKLYEEVFSFYPTNSFSRDKLNYESGTVKNIHYGDIHTKFSSRFEVKEELVPYINESIDLTKVKDENYCQEGDLVIADASEDYTDIGKTIELVELNNEKLVAGLHTFLARPNKTKMYKGFSGYLVQAPYVRKQVMTIAQGTKVLSLSPSRLGKVKLEIPVIEEQQKIATYLSSIDTKIETVTTQITETQTFKKGLLQQMFV